MLFNLVGEIAVRFLILLDCALTAVYYLSFLLGLVILYHLLLLSIWPSQR